MKLSKFSEEQVVYALWQAESGTSVGGVCLPPTGEAIRAGAPMTVNVTRRLRPKE